MKSLSTVGACNNPACPPQVIAGVRWLSVRTGADLCQGAQRRTATKAMSPGCVSRDLFLLPSPPPPSAVLHQAEGRAVNPKGGAVGPCTTGTAAHWRGVGRVVSVFRLALEEGCRAGWRSQLDGLAVGRTPPAKEGGGVEVALTLGGEV